MNITFQGFESLAKVPLRMTLREFFRLRDEDGEYSCTIPTGVFPGKKWLRHDGIYDPRCPPSERRWMLCWYSDAFVNAKGVEMCRNEHIIIEFVDDEGVLLDNQDPLNRIRRP